MLLGLRRQIKSAVTQNTSGLGGENSLKMWQGPLPNEPGLKALHCRPANWALTTGNSQFASAVCRKFPNFNISFAEFYGIFYMHNLLSLPAIH